MNKTIGITQGNKQDRVVRRRLLLRQKCVKLVQSGKSASEVARIHRQSPRAVAYWVTRFKLHGAEGLADMRSQSGRKSCLAASQMKKVVSFIKGFKTKSQLLTGAILSRYIKNTFGITLTLRQCQRILKQTSGK